MTTLWDDAVALVSPSTGMDTVRTALEMFLYCIVLQFVIGHLHDATQLILPHSSAPTPSQSRHMS